MKKDLEKEKPRPKEVKTEEEKTLERVKKSPLQKFFEPIHLSDSEEFISS